MIDFDCDFLSLSKSKRSKYLWFLFLLCVFSASLDSGAVHEEGDFRRALAIVFSRRFGVTSGEHQITAPRCRERHPLNHHNLCLFLFVASVCLRVEVFHQIFLLSHQEWILVHDRCFFFWWAFHWGLPARGRHDQPRPGTEGKCGSSISRNLQNDVLSGPHDRLQLEKSTLVMTVDEENLMLVWMQLLT